MKSERESELKNIMGIVGSPRRNGNTHILVSKILEGAKGEGALCEELFLKDLKIEECDGCDLCWSEGDCQQADDMRGLYPKINTVDWFIFGTPIYWYGPTSLMKSFLDRFYYYCGGEHQGKMRGKSAALVLVFEEKDPAAANATLEMFQRSFDYLGIHLRHRLIVPGVGPKGAIWKKTQTIEEAFALGQSLAR